MTSITETKHKAYRFKPVTEIVSQLVPVSLAGNSRLK